MQLSPSFASPDPNLLASAFPVAAALSAESAPPVGPSGPGAAFSDVFAGLVSGAAAGATGDSAGAVASDTKPAASVASVFSPPISLGAPATLRSQHPPIAPAKNRDEAAPEPVPVAESAPKDESIDIAQPMVGSDARRLFRSAPKVAVPEQRDRAREPERVEPAASPAPWLPPPGSEWVPANGTPVPEANCASEHSFEETADEPAQSTSQGWVETPVARQPEFSAAPRSALLAEPSSGETRVESIPPDRTALPQRNAVAPVTSPDSTKSEASARSATRPLESHAPVAPRAGKLPPTTPPALTETELPSSFEPVPTRPRAEPVSASRREKMQRTERPSERALADAAMNVASLAPVEPVAADTALAQTGEGERPRSRESATGTPTAASWPASDGPSPKHAAPPAPTLAQSGEDFDFDSPSSERGTGSAFAAPVPELTAQPVAPPEADPVIAEKVFASLAAEMPQAPEASEAAPPSPALLEPVRATPRAGDRTDATGGVQRLFRTQENFAARPAPLAGRSDDDEKRVDKSFVATEREIVTTTQEIVGIAGAKTDATMFRRSAPPSLSHPASGYASAAAGVPAPVLDAPASPVLGIDNMRFEPVGTAHHAVEAVLQAVDHVASRERNAVNLEFSVGGADLKVRIELRADEVRTTFHTDSTELRAALTHEWQALTSAPNADRGLRLAPAVFVSVDQAALNGFAGDASSQQRDRRARNDQPLPAVRMRGLGAPAGRVAVQPAAQPAAAVASSRHLHTLA